MVNLKNIKRGKLGDRNFLHKEFEKHGDYPTTEENVPYTDLKPGKHYFINIGEGPYKKYPGLEEEKVYNYSEIKKVLDYFNKHHDGKTVIYVNQID